jgi:hypothetical protein
MVTGRTKAEAREYMRGYMREYRKRKKAAATPITRPAQRLRVLVLLDDLIVQDIDAMTDMSQINRLTPVYESGESDEFNTYRRTGWTHLTIDFRVTDPS